jgi:hypothetical protein
MEKLEIDQITIIVVLGFELMTLHLLGSVLLSRNSPKLFALPIVEEGFINTPNGLDLGATHTSHITGLTGTHHHAQHSIG